MPRNSSVDLATALRDPLRYERQIERLHVRAYRAASLYDLQQDGVSLASLVMHKREVSRLFARTVGRGEYEMAPARVTQILVDGKRRTIYALRLSDLVVHGVVATLLEDAVAPRLSGHLYSYRKGRSWWTTVSNFAAFVRRHRRERPDPRTRGLYVLRRDVQSYTDNIPLGDHSPLWPMLRAELADARGRVPTGPEWDLVVKVVRPEAYEEAGRPFSLWRGLPTGLSITCPLFNIYLHQLDAELGSVPGGFYARYSDDIIFAHPDPREARAASARMDAVLAHLGLRFNADKQRDLYLTAAGRPSTAWPEAKPAMGAPLLGCRVTAHGQVALNRKKVRRLLREIATRAEQTARTAPVRHPERLGPLVCSVINGVLARRGDPLGPRAAELARRTVTDRRQLQQLDYWIARIVAQAVTGNPGAGAFRDVPFRRIRRRWRLTSLVAARNRCGSGGAR